MDETTAAGTNTEVRAPHLDWRSGKTVVQRDDAFWREHERRRVEQGLSVREYCRANDLSLSTYRHRVNGRARVAPASGTRANTKAAPSSPAFVAVTSTPAAAGIEIVLEGMTMRLCGGAAERVLARVMERLA